MLQNRHERAFTDLAMIGHDDGYATATQLDMTSSLTNLLKAEPNQAPDNVSAR